MALDDRGGGRADRLPEAPIAVRRVGQNRRRVVGRRVSGHDGARRDAQCYEGGAEKGALASEKFFYQDVAAAARGAATPLDTNHVSLLALQPAKRLVPTNPSP